MTAALAGSVGVTPLEKWEGRQKLLGMFCS